MPVTPVTAVLFDPAYVQQEYPVLAQRLRDSHSDVVISHRQFQPECAANKRKIHFIGFFFCWFLACLLP